mmetsp:Transcript_8064/g.19977  ORF Transcript_8064/g.19977 Transcript_8064/m.19977 type:complete len:240 (-) Transcript_8064:746-1465(-)
MPGRAPSNLLAGSNTPSSQMAGFAFASSFRSVVRVPEGGVEWLNMPVPIAESDLSSSSLSCAACGSTKGPGFSAPLRSAFSARSRSALSFSACSRFSFSNSYALGTAVLLLAITTSPSTSSSESPSTSSIVIDCLAPLDSQLLRDFSRSICEQRRCSWASLLCGSRESTTSKSSSARWCCERRRCAMPRRRYALVYESSSWIAAVVSASAWRYCLSFRWHIPRFAYTTALFCCSRSEWV